MDSVLKIGLVALLVTLAFTSPFFATILLVLLSILFSCIISFQNWRQSKAQMRKFQMVTKQM